MRILSIDFDYFQRVCERTALRYYPDPTDLSTPLTIMTWASSYADRVGGEKIREVGINRKELNFLKTILKNQDADCPVMIANSHKHIYDMVHDLADESEPLAIVNVDMHPDYDNGYSDVDCGNWLGFLDREYPHTHLTWVAHAIPLRNKLVEEFTCGLVLNSLEPLITEQFDAIFLCRSDSWSPPHLDKYFNELCNTIGAHFDTAKIEVSVKEPRSMEEIEELCRQIEQFFIDGMKENELKRQQKIIKNS